VSQLFQDRTEEPPQANSFFGRALISGHVQRLDDMTQIRKAQIVTAPTVTEPAAKVWLAPMWVIKGNLERIRWEFPENFKENACISDS
jgi:hypothetical protein